MNKKEKVIKGLECCAHEEIGDCDNCPYNENTPHCDIAMMRDALALLKAQEPKYPVYTALNGLFAGKNLSHWNCGACGAFLYNDEWFGSTLKDDRPKYCSRCGQAVKWE